MLAIVEDDAVEHRAGVILALGQQFEPCFKFLSISTLSVRLLLMRNAVLLEHGGHSRLDGPVLLLERTPSFLLHPRDQLARIEIPCSLDADVPLSRRIVPIAGNQERSATETIDHAFFCGDNRRCVDIPTPRTIDDIDDLRTPITRNLEAIRPGIDSRVKDRHDNATTIH